MENVNFINHKPTPQWKFPLTFYNLFLKPSLSDMFSEAGVPGA